MSSFALPSGYPRIRRVHSFHELIATPFGGGVNALCWPRTLPGNFGEIVERLECRDELETLDESRLRSLPLSVDGRIALDCLLEDYQRLREHNLDPVLNCLRSYPREEQPGPVATDVCSFHVDSATVEADTWLCTYHGAPSEGLRNDQAQRRVDIPGTRAELLRLFGGNDGPDFHDYLRENCYDLHYAPVGEAQPFSFGVGNLWRIAVAWPGSPVPPCIHRAPATSSGQPARLLLIS